MKIATCHVLVYSILWQGVLSINVNQSAYITPANPSQNGVSASILKDIAMGWNMIPTDEIGFLLKLTMNSSFSFHPTQISALTINMQSDTPLGDYPLHDRDLLISFSQSDDKYISVKMSIDMNNPHKIYPQCDKFAPYGASFADGNIESLCNNNNGQDRENKVSNNLNWFELAPGNILQYPLIFKFENHPLDDYTLFIYKYNDMLQYECGFSPALKPNIPLKVFISPEDDDETFSITAIQITIQVAQHTQPDTTEQSTTAKQSTTTTQSIEAPVETKSESTSKVTQETWILPVIVIGILILIIFGTWLFVLYCKKKQMQNQIEDMLSKTILIKNPLCILFAIGEYDRDPQNPDLDADVNDLNVDVDINNLLSLFRDRLQYDVAPIYGKHPSIYWKQNDIIKFLKQQAEMFANNVISNKLNENKKNYDGLIIVCSCHGVNNKLISSDIKLIDKDVIHRIFSSYYPVTREVPRVIIYDMCDGNEDRKGIKNVKPSKGYAISDITAPVTHVGKNYEVSDIPIPRFHHQDSDGPALWEHSAKNPDHNLATIHAANRGFQSKMNSFSGSYLINKFVSKTLAAISQSIDEQPFLSQTLDAIQAELGVIEKTQLPTYTFNNGTGFIKFVPKSRELHMI